MQTASCSIDSTRIKTGHLNDALIPSLVNSEPKENARKNILLFCIKTP